MVSLSLDKGMCPQVTSSKISLLLHLGQVAQSSSAGRVGTFQAWEGGSPNPQPYLQLGSLTGDGVPCTALNSHVSAEI